MDLFLIILALVLIVFLVILSLHHHLRQIYLRLKKNKLELLEKLDLRLDNLPYLLSVFKKHSPKETEIFEKLVRARKEAREARGDLSHRALKEREINQYLKKLEEKVPQHPSLKYDLSFLEAKKDVQDLREEINLWVEKYNSLGDEYNFKVKIFPYFLAAKIFGLKKEPLFHFL